MTKCWFEMVSNFKYFYTTILGVKSGMALPYLKFEFAIISSDFSTDPDRLAIYMMDATL